MDILTKEAEETKSVNTIYLKDQKIIGHNTDIAGFELAIRSYGYDVKKKNIFIFGAGGVVPSIIVALKRMGALKIFLYNRTLTKSESIKKIVLEGSGIEDVDFSYTSKRGRRIEIVRPFEGVLNRILRKYQESDSSLIREDMAKFMTLKPCSSCGGTRLNETARNVFIEDFSLPDISELTIEEAFLFFKKLKLKGAKGKIAEKIINEIIERLNF